MKSWREREIETLVETMSSKKNDRKERKYEGIEQTRNKKRRRKKEEKKKKRREEKKKKRRKRNGKRRKEKKNTGYDLNFLIWVNM